MITSNLRINQLSEKAYGKYLSYLKCMDKKDINGYGEFLSDDVTIQFNNDAPMKGKEAVLKGLNEYWQSFEEVKHDLTNIYGSDSAYVLEALNHYIRKDGKKVTVKAVAFTDVDDNGLVTSVRIYQDSSPVFA